MTKSTGAHDRARKRDALVVQMIRDGASYDDICTATGIDRTRISLLKKRNGLQHVKRPPCSVDECDREQNSNGYCQMHSTRLKQHGMLDLPPTDDRVTQWYRVNADSARESTKRYRARNPHKRRAHRKVEVEIRTGRMIRQPCEVCGSEKSHAHHDDYSKPLDVVWLCRTHHMAHHKMLRDQQRDPDAA